jgi:hypothetical protein
MSALSIQLENGIFSICANPIFPISEFSASLGSQFVFEVFEADAHSLKFRIGQIDHFAMDGAAFWAKVTSLEPCVSTHTGLALLREKPTMRGVLTLEPVSYVPQAAGRIN